MVKKIKRVKDISKEEDDFTLGEIEEGLRDLIKEGFIAGILSIKEDGKKEMSYINSSQVIVKCPHCNNIVNVGKKNPHPQSVEEQTMNGLEDGIKKGYIKEVPQSEGEERAFKISEDGLKYVEQEIMKTREGRLEAWHTFYNLIKSKHKEPMESLIESLEMIYFGMNRKEIVDDLIQGIKDGLIGGISVDEKNKDKIVKAIEEYHKISKKDAKDEEGVK